MAVGLAAVPAGRMAALAEFHPGLGEAVAPAEKVAGREVQVAPVEKVAGRGAQVEQAEMEAGIRAQAEPGAVARIPPVRRASSARARTTTPFTRRCR